MLLTEACSQLCLRNCVAAAIKKGEHAEDCLQQDHTLNGYNFHAMSERIAARMMLSRQSASRAETEG